MIQLILAWYETKHLRWLNCETQLIKLILSGILTSDSPNKCEQTGFYFIAEQVLNTNYCPLRKHCIVQHFACWLQIGNNVFQVTWITPTINKSSTFVCAGNLFALNMDNGVNTCSVFWKRKGAAKKTFWASGWLSLCIVSFSWFYQFTFFISNMKDGD